MRWSPDKVMVLFSKVLVVLYFIITSGCLLRNAFISLYVISPDDEAIIGKNMFVSHRNIKAAALYIKLFLFTFLM